MATPVKLTISLSEVAKTSLPASLEARLQSSPPSPTKADLEASEARAERLRAAYLEAVKDRAARESQRAADAAARKRRLAASKLDKVQRKMAAAVSHAAAKKEADEVEREARKQKNQQAFEAVAEARAAAAAARIARQAELATAEKSANAKHSRIVQAVIDKSVKTVKHAQAVVESRKAHEAAMLAEAQERLEAKLSRAALSRSSRLSKEGVSPATSPKRKAAVGVTPPPGARFRVLNDAKYKSETLRRSLDAAMAKAQEKREARLQATVDKATGALAKVASVVAAQQARATGEDEDAKAVKQQLYMKLNNVEVARLTNLKAKAAPKAGAKDGLVLVLDETPLDALRKLPTALAERLSATPHPLLESADARHAAAAAKRTARLTALALQATRANERRAAALARVRAKLTTLTAKVHAKAAAAAKAHAESVAKRVATAAITKARVLKAAGVRRAALEATAAKKAGALAKAMAKSNVKAAHQGRVATRLAAFRNRREAADAARAAAAAAHLAKGVRAAASRSAHLAARVETAKRLGLLKGAEPSSVA